MVSDPDPERIRRFYDRFGARQDKQAFYEDAALDDLVARGAFEQAQNVLEIGCGTGRLAARLLAGPLSATASYTGTDISSTMTGLARDRLIPWADRARVIQTDGGFDPAALDGPFDRVVVTYVFDLLPHARITEALAAIHTVLSPGGLLCAVSLTHGPGPLSRLTSTLWAGVHRLNPYLVGGCRPIDLSAMLAPADWRVRHRACVVSATVPSEVVIAAPLPANPAPPGADQ